MSKKPYITEIFSHSLRDFEMPYGKVSSVWNKKKKEEPVRRKGIYFLMKNINLLGTKMFSAPALCICTKSKNNVLINTAFCCFLLNTQMIKPIKFNGYCRMEKNYQKAKLSTLF